MRVLSEKKIISFFSNFRSKENKIDPTISPLHEQFSIHINEIPFRFAKMDFTNYSKNRKEINAISTIWKVYWNSLMFFQSNEFCPLIPFEWIIFTGNPIFLLSSYKYPNMFFFRLITLSVAYGLRYNVMDETHFLNAYTG